MLAAYPEDLSASALRQLQELGVEVMTGVRAQNLTENGLEVAGKFIPSRVKNPGPPATRRRLSAKR